VLVLTGSLPKSKDAGVSDARKACPIPAKLTTGAGDVKFPCNATVPVREPRAVGVKVTLIEQLAPTAREVPQVLVWAKSPVIKTPVIVAVVSPELVNVTACAELVVLSGVPPKLSDAGDAVARTACPVPLRAADTVVPTKLPATDSVAVLLPRAVGANVTFTVQLAPAASDAPQLLVWLKSLLRGSGLIAVMEIAASPLLVRTSDCAALVVPITCGEKLNEEGASDGAGNVPDPERLTALIGVVALLLKLREPLREPTPAGVNVTATVQFAPTAKEVPQVFVWAKSPVLATPDTESARSPEFVNVTLWAALVVFTDCEPKFMVVGETVA